MKKEACYLACLCASCLVNCLMILPMCPSSISTQNLLGRIDLHCMHHVVMLRLRSLSIYCSKRGRGHVDAAGVCCRAPARAQFPVPIAYFGARDLTGGLYLFCKSGLHPRNTPLQGELERPLCLIGCGWQNSSDNFPCTFLKVSYS